MNFDFKQIGQRLRAYRMGANLTPEQVADKLGISRAALYKYEKGDVIKLETIEKLSTLLDISISSLLGIEVEYFTNAVSFFERMRQVEAESDQVLVYFESLSFLLSSPEYAENLHAMLIEGLPTELSSSAHVRAEIDRVIAILVERRSEMSRRSQPSMISIVGSTQIRRFLRAGLIGTYRLAPSERRKRRALARVQVEHMITLMENEPIGVQTGIVADTLPNQHFQIFRRRTSTVVAVSPFRLGELPNIRLGVASITSTQAAASLYLAVFEDLWRRAYKGARGADFLRSLLQEVDHEGDDNDR